MGCIQFIEEQDLCCGDSQASRHLQFNLSNVDQEQLHILAENEEEEKTETRQTQKGNLSNSNSNKRLCQKCKERPKNHKTMSNDSLFQSMPQSARTSNPIDHYHLSRKIFDSLNDVRMRPESYQSLFSGLDETCDSRYKGIKDMIEACNINSANSSSNASKELRLIQQHLFLNKSGNVILWNEAVYSTTLTFIENSKKRGEPFSSLASELNLMINDALKGKYSCVVFDLIGNYSSELCFWNLIYNNAERLKELCLDRYHSGAICCVPSKDKEPMRTVLALINKVNGSNDNDFDKHINGDIVNARSGSNHQNDIIVFNNQMLNELLDEEQIHGGDFLSESNSMLFQFANEEIKK